MSIVCEKNYRCVHQYWCALAIYLLTVLSSSYGIIIDLVNNSLCHVNIVIDELNATEKLYLKVEMEIIGRLESDDTSKIVLNPSASK